MNLFETQKLVVVLKGRVIELEKERDGYKRQIEAADNVIATYGINGALLHDRVFQLAQLLEAERDKLLKELCETVACHVNPNSCRHDWVKEMFCYYNKEVRMKLMICPRCRSRASKIFSVSTGEIQCQMCNFKWRDEDMRKLYIYTNMESGEGVYYAMADDGVVLASHYCSSINFAISDLVGNRPERKQMYRNHFGGEMGEAFELVLLENGELPPKEVLELNDKLEPEKTINSVEVKVETGTPFAKNIVGAIHDSIVFSEANTKIIIDQVIVAVRKACKKAYSDYYGIRDTQSACLDAMNNVKIEED